MIKFLQKLRKSNSSSGCMPCSPCALPDSGCYENEFYAQAEYEDDIAPIVNTGSSPPCEIEGAGSSLSCISYKDAYNKALEKSMTQALMQLRNCNSQANFEEWLATMWANSSIVKITICPCGWDGGGESVIDPDYYTGYTPAEANYNAFQANPGIPCTPPS